MHERSNINQFSNLRFLRPGRLALASAGIEAVGIIASVVSKNPDYYQAMGPLAVIGNAGLAAYDTAINEQSMYLGGLFRKPEES